ncbi:unnamed protein product [Linum trigynum]|uniref:Uncharacterized protein n=1 Tax=Linum trigynum TaxID=586398 RepID=A0AAV2G8U0_9ROSI
MEEDIGSYLTHTMETSKANKEEKDDDITLTKEMTIHEEASKCILNVKRLIVSLGGEDSLMLLLESIIDTKSLREKLLQLLKKDRIEKTNINSTPYGHKELIRVYEKKEDPGHFTINCLLDDHYLEQGRVDVGSSINILPLPL